MIISFVDDFLLNYVIIDGKVPQRIATILFNPRVPVVFSQSLDDGINASLPKFVCGMGGVVISYKLIPRTRALNQPCCE